MSAFQVCGLSFMLALFVFSLLSRMRGRISRWVGLGWMSLWCLGALMLLFPNSTGVIANHLGIHRGADLVSYCFIMCGLLAFFCVYVRLRRIERDLTRLVRDKAVRQGLIEHGRISSSENHPVASQSE